MHTTGGARFNPTRICSQCGTPAASGEVFCGECGQPLPVPGSPQQTPEAAPTKQPGLAKIVIAGLLVVLIGGGGWFAFRRLLYSPSPAPQVTKSVAGTSTESPPGTEPGSLVPPRPVSKLTPQQAPRARPQASDDQLRARELLNKGVAAYKVKNFDEAISCFRQVKELDLISVNARLYLATAYASKYIPGAPGKENARLAEKAIEEYKGVLQLDPNNLPAIDGMASTLYNSGGTPFDPKKFDESKLYHKLHIKLKPADPEPFYWIGVIDWSMAYRKKKELREIYNKTASEKLPNDEALPPWLTAAFVRDYGSIVDEGISCLKKAIGLRPDYDDAMAYLNLLYRQRADMEWNREDRDRDLRLADDLVDQVKKTKEKKIQTQPPGP